MTPIKRRYIVIFFALCWSEALCQLAEAPALVVKPSIQYPPIARAAHVEGDVVVQFSIDSDGRTSSVEVVSGSMMLRSAVSDQIGQWRFAVPLPANAQTNFEAVYKFRREATDDTVDDDLDAPPYYPCCGDVISLPADASQVSGEVHSIDGTQKIDVTPAPPKPPPDQCPDDKEKHLPEGSNSIDYIELFRAWSKGHRDYKVRIYRDGRVEWLGRDDVAMKGINQAGIRREAATALMAKFESATFWSACSKVPPTLDEDRDGDDFRSGDYLTVKIGEHTKSVDASAMPRLLWAVDKAADTHQWIHGDSATEPSQNMSADIGMPKPGMTALMRAAFHFSPVSGQQTLDALKRLLTTPGVDVDAVDASGWTALMYAAKLTSDDQAIGMLLDANANANRVSLHGDTALMMAAYEGRLSERLLKSGADINAQNGDGVTALMLLSQSMHPDELKDAIAAGADATAKDRKGRTALDYLRAASCNRAIVPLPKPWVEVGYKEPPPCPSNTEEYQASEVILRLAMKKVPQ